MPEAYYTTRELVDPSVMRVPIVWLFSDLADGLTGGRYVANRWDFTVDDPSRAALGQCAPALDPNTLTDDFRVRMTYASTIIRWTP